MRLAWETRALLVLAVVLCLMTEGTARFGLQRVSKLHRRILQERGEARKITQPEADGRRKILFIGNSLLLEGVDMGLLNTGVQARFQAQRYPVEQTYYLDWLYGLTRLLREGMRPDTVVLCLNPPQLTSSLIRGDFSANVLFGVQDIWPAARNSSADLTKISGYYLAHYSMFYATRGELRTVLMFHMAPPVAAMWHQAVTTGPVIPPDEELIASMVPRLLKMKELCANNGVRFAFLVPPTDQPGDVAIMRAGERANVPVLRPIPNGSLSRGLYRDGFHLNSQGAAIFTTAIVKEMMYGRI